MLNHTAFDNPVLADHLDMSFNNANTPQLIPAIELELAIQGVSDSLEEEAFPINSERALDNVMVRIRAEVGSLRFEEYWLICVDSILHVLSSFFSISSIPLPEYQVSDSLLQELFKEALFEDNIGHRFPLSLHIEPFKRAITSHGLNRDQIEQVVASFNSLIRTTLIAPLLASIFSSIRGAIHYRFLERRPPSPTPSSHYPLLDPYFTPIATRCRRDSYSSIAGIASATSATSATNATNATNTTSATNTTNTDGLCGGCCYCANNGWTWDNHRNPLNLASHPHPLFVDGKLADYVINTKYLKRELVVWGDCVKLRYFDEHGDFTSAFAVVREYIEVSAFLFDGFRLDNCHNTSLRLLEALVPIARAVNPHLVLLAELFTQDQAVDQQYISALSIDMIVRETIPSAPPAASLRAYSDSLYHAGGQELGSLSSIRECPCCLVTTPLPTVLYDITHDNPSFTALYGTPAISAVTVLNALCVTHCASTKGFDEGYPRNPAVVETRLYRPLHPSMTDWAEDDVLQFRASLLEGCTPEHAESQGNTHLRLLMNHLHQLLSQSGFCERYVHHYAPTPILSIERRFTGSFYSVVGITRTAFTPHSPEPIDITLIGRVVGVFVSVRCNDDCVACTEETACTEKTACTEEAQQCDEAAELEGRSFSLDVRCDALHSFCSLSPAGSDTTLHFSAAFTPGASVVLLVYNGTAAHFDHFLTYSECGLSVPSYPQAVQWSPQPKTASPRSLYTPILPWRPSRSTWSSRIPPSPTSAISSSPPTRSRRP